MKKMKNTEEKKGGKEKLLLLLILLLVILIGIGGGVLYRMIQDTKRSPLARDEMALGGMLPGKDPAEIEELLNAKIEEGMVDIGIAAEPVFEYNGKKGRLGIENVAVNHYSFQVALQLDETKEVVYESGIIDPGYYVEFVELNRKLQAGDYPATAVFSTYSLAESEDQIAQTRVKLLLHITDGAFYQ